MGLFEDFKEKTVKQQQQEDMHQFLEKFQFDTLDENDLNLLKKIATGLIDQTYYKMPTIITNDSDNKVKATLLSALVDQNWMILRQLSQLNTNIEKLINK